MQVSASIALVLVVCVALVISKQASLRILLSLSLALAFWQPGQTRNAKGMDGQMIRDIEPLNHFWFQAPGHAKGPTTNCEPSP